MYAIFPALNEGEVMKISLCNIRAVRSDLSLAAEGTFHEGIHIVTGDVGSGKTTLAHILAGLLPPFSGTVRRHGITSQMMMLQSPESHITGSTLYEECRSWGVTTREVLVFAGLEGRDDEDPLRLSRGELKRFILACVLFRPYDLLILDEPFSSLDCQEKERLCRILSSRSAGITILFTHEQAFFPKADRIWEIGNGTLHDRGRLPEALYHWEHAPQMVKRLVKKGTVPANISQADLLEALCRT